jgi:hypothetical protein
MTKATAEHDRTLCNDTDKTHEATLFTHRDPPDG